MYAVRAGGVLHVLLRAPFANGENSGYFSCAEDLSDKTDVRELGRVTCYLCVIGEDMYIAKLYKRKHHKTKNLPRAKF